MAEQNGWEALNILKNIDIIQIVIQQLSSNEQCILSRTDQLVSMQKG